ncbi:MAG: hypothetical protein IPH12_10995 [Saprospirales bacterium]|nr:hypothetical protein [Saprospirales bacterium]MBK8922334.1 hypothetical protein [Saprospirales bacterium]
MKLPISTGFVFILIIGLAWAGCKKDEKRDYLAEADCTLIDPETNRYTNVVQPIMLLSCALSGCHDAATQSEGINLSTYTGVKTAFQTKDVLCAINHGEGCEPMPKGGAKLNGATLNLLACWAKNGYKE